MKLDKKNFFYHLNNNFLFEENPSIAVAVSGGPDSLALVYLLNQWVKLKNGSIIAILVDHKLRKESFNECKFTSNFLNKLNINNKILNVSKKNLQKKNMSEARVNRYTKLINYCKKNNIIHLFLAHHLNDNLETFLIRKVGASNLEGLESMTFSKSINKIQIIRPLLKFTKIQILQFNKKNNIPYFFDPSNSNTKYTRVIVRDFLTKKNIINDIKKDYNLVIRYTPFYKKMINVILLKLIVQIKKQSTIISLERFEKLDDCIKEKIIEKIHTYLKKNQNKLRYSKIRDLIIKLKNSKEQKFNLASMIVVKSNKNLNFSINK